MPRMAASPQTTPRPRLVTGKSPGKSSRQVSKHGREPTNVRAFGRDIAASFWTIGAEVAKLGMAFGAWKLVDLLLLQFFGESPSGDAKIFSSIAHWGTMATVVVPRFITVLTEILALTLRFLRTLAAGTHGVVVALKTGKIDPEESA